MVRLHNPVAKGQRAGIMLISLPIGRVHLHIPREGPSGMTPETPGSVYQYKMSFYSTCGMALDGLDW